MGFNEVDIVIKTAERNDLSQLKNQDLLAPTNRVRAINTRQARAVPAAVLGVCAVGGRIARPAVARDCTGAVGLGAGAGQGRVYDQAGPGHGQAGLFF